MNFWGVFSWVEKIFNQFLVEFLPLAHLVWYDDPPEDGNSGQRIHGTHSWLFVSDTRVQRGEIRLPLLRYRLCILESWNEILYTGRLGFRIFWSQKGKIWDLPQSVRRKPITMQGVRPRSQPSLLDKCRHQDQKNWNQGSRAPHFMGQPVIFYIKFISLLVPFPFPSKNSPSTEGLEGP